MDRIIFTLYPCNLLCASVLFSTGAHLILSVSVYRCNFQLCTATLFLELWKRKQALIAWQWDLYQVTEDDDTRPEYDLSNTRFKINPVTRRKEPYIPTYEKVFKILLSTVVVTFMVCSVLICTNF